MGTLTGPVPFQALPPFMSTFLHTMVWHQEIQYSLNSNKWGAHLLNPLALAWSFAHKSHMTLSYCSVRLDFIWEGVQLTVQQRIHLQCVTYFSSGCDGGHSSAHTHILMPASNCIFQGRLQGPELTMELTLYFQSGRQEEAEQFDKYATRVSVFLFYK